MLHNSGFDTGVNLQKLAAASNFILTALSKPTQSKVGLVLQNIHR